MRTMELYLFEDLSESGKAKAISENRHINVQNDDWAKNIIHDATIELEQLGFNGVHFKMVDFENKKALTHFYAQLVDLDLLFRALKLYSKYKTVLEKTQSYRLIKSGVDLPNEQSVMSDLRHSCNTDKQLQLIAELDQIVLNKSYHFMKFVHDDLEREYQRLTSDLSVSETLIEKKMEFEDVKG